MSTTKNKRSILKCIELFNKCTLEWIDTCYSQKLDWIEFSNPSIPQGRKGDYSAFRTAAENLLRFFPDRKLTVLRSVGEGDCVVLEQEWNGTLAFNTANHNAGEISKLRIVSFFTLENELIIKQIDYCAQAN